MTLFSSIKKIYPHLEITLKQARIKEDPEKLVKKNMTIVIFFTAIINVLFFFIFLKEGTLGFILITLILFFLITFFIVFSLPKFAMKKIKNEIESDLLYSGRYFLLKIESGQPLINALIDVSATDTKSAKYFGEIVSDIYLGKPIEEAIDYAVKYSPSKAFKKLLEQLKNALSTGADIKDSLKSTMNEVIKQRIVDIQTYGKKLAPLAMFYMIVGTIVPSLGAAMIVIGLSFMNITMTLGVLLGLVGLIAVLQYFFLLFFKSIRPSVSL